MKNNNIETTKLLERIDTKVFFMIVGLMLILPLYIKLWH